METDWKWVMPYLGTGVGFGLVTGWAVGFLAKKAAKLLALAMAALFIVLQLLVVNNYLKVNWPGLATAFGHATHSVATNSSHAWAPLLVHFPYAGAFAVGFFMGFRKG